MTVAKANKLRGGYYTPEPVAAWLVAWAVRSGKDRILEPSCGDGVFLSAASRRLMRYRRNWVSESAQVVGIELSPEEAAKAAAKSDDYTAVIPCDFFEWAHRGEAGTFDAVVGNPPFIRYQNFPQRSRNRAMQFMQSLGLQPNRLTNIWVPFVVASSYLLREGGRLAMVLPAELLQVSYAAQLRKYLADSFHHITIYACNEMFFANAEQEVVLVLAEDKLPERNSSSCCDIDVIATQSVAELLNEPATSNRDGTNVKIVQHDTEKWLKYFLDAREIALMRAFREHPKLASLKEHATVDVGVVTGKNEFFVLSQSAVKEFQLHDYVVPLVARSAHLSGAVIGEAEHRRLRDAGNRVLLLRLPENLESIPGGLRMLIREGERKGMHLGYKCRIRHPWYSVPAVWEPDCFFFRQIYDFPRVVLNKAGATSTDTIHRMRCKGPAEQVAANLYTYLTAASAEIEGRSYGGGVLELEPTEAERLLVPKLMNGAMRIEEADSLIRQGKLEVVLNYNDKAVLRNSLGLTERDCAMLRRIWTKMRDRRMSRRRGN